MKEFKERLEKYAKMMYGMGQTRFEDYCGIAHGTISAIKANGPSASVVTRIAVKCPEMNLNWLFTGEGSMVNEEEKETRKETPSSTSLPLIPFDAVAGPGDPVYEDERVEDYYTVSEFKESDFLIRVKGDSMTPKFTGGDLLACKKIDVNNGLFFLQWGRCYVIYTRSQGCMVKRVQPSDKDGYIKCVSDNVKYAPFDVPMSDVVSVALVNGSISLE